MCFHQQRLGFICNKAIVYTLVFLLDFDVSHLQTNYIVCYIGSFTTVDLGYWYVIDLPTLHIFVWHMNNCIISKNILDQQYLLQHQQIYTIYCCLLDLWKQWDTFETPDSDCVVLVLYLSEFPIVMIQRVRLRT